MERRRRRSFTPEFRAEAVKLVREGSKSLPQVAKDLDLTESALRNWVREAEGGEDKNPAAGVLTGAEREELVRLRKENRQLTMGRDFLKNRRSGNGGPRGGGRHPHGSWSRGSGLPDRHGGPQWDGEPHRHRGQVLRDTLRRCPGLDAEPICGQGHRALQSH
ncbi:transposase [Cystobacter fuscus]|nr:transposase [Cystobacter fuscus]